MPSFATGYIGTGLGCVEMRLFIRCLKVKNLPCDGLVCVKSWYKENKNCPLVLSIEN